jgi:glycosyltransferase involved in cell wall biosynthesis
MIEVLLTTYNGEQFLAQQIDSILSQVRVELRIIVRDDGSSDNTKFVLGSYLRDYPGKIVLLDSSERIGVSSGINQLLNQTREPYVAFCDQDDVWIDNKLDRLLAHMQSLEAIYGHDYPLLVHSDLSVVDKDLHIIHPSYWNYSGVDPKRNSLRQTLIKNSVTGCALLVNRALVEKAIPIPDGAAMHDHWFAMVATTFGRIETINEPMVLYRQHESNVLGARRYNWHEIFRRLWISCGRMDISRHRKQASEFMRRFASQLNSDQYALVDGFAHLPKRSWVGRRLFLLRHGILLPGLIRNLALMFCVRLGK